ncbi:MAG TPA: GtrA family protein [Gammaproteobacteria bacterium]|nr:GtrA family protein [Gammaproteobacteria bacterium]
MQLLLLYSFFAIISTIANIASQDISIQLYSGAYSVVLSVFIGTGAGLVVKYLLDKKYIFKFKVDNLQHDSQTFILYTLMGLLTTVIFWGFEFSFDYIYQTKEMRYLGGVIGLAIGYWIKYHLDKKFVFKRRTA